MNLGISVYLDKNIEDILNYLLKAKENHFEYVFSSIHIPEYDISKCKEKLVIIANKCKEYQLQLFIDISPRALQLFEIPSFQNLKELGVTHLRPDFGFSSKEIVELSKDFNIVLNASTITKQHFEELVSLGLNKEKVICCHNYYPKIYSGLSINKIIEINDYIHSLGLQVMGFVQGDMDLKGPMFEGLPTVEDLRNKNTFENALYMDKFLHNDIVLVSDFGLSDNSFTKFKQYKEGYIELECELLDGYEFFTTYIHHDRVDNSEYFIRSSESIYKHYIDKEIEANNTIDRKPYDICVSNKKYGRYNGELEILKKELESDERVNVVGHVKTKLIDYIDNNTGFVLKKV